MKTNYPTYRYYSLKFNANRTFQMTPETVCQVDEEVPEVPQ